ncbi:MAG: 16S rRNA (uracil(1498)-N(3))-methyltransferase [Pyrinomonadaceae bacterium]
MRRFFAPIESFHDGHVKLSPEETRHLRAVLRLRVGDEVLVFDGTGREFQCTINEIAKQNSVVSVIEEIAPASPESPFEITLAATVLNGEKYDLVIQKAVELGVTTFIPLHTVHCDVKPKDATKRMIRWRRIALEATKQSGRAKIMQIGEPAAFTDLLEIEESETLVLFSEREGNDDFLDIKPAKKITAIVGPKGGWDDSELALARSKKIKIVTLGGRILRAETAAISITAILQHKFGDLN